MASVYWEMQGYAFKVPVGDFGFSVTLFTSFSTIAFIILFSRRCCAGGELGGRTVSKIITTVIFILLWVILTLLISLEAYDIIEPGF